MARCMNALLLLFFVSGQSGSVRDPGVNLKREVCESWCGCVMACLLDGCLSTVCVPTHVIEQGVSLNMESGICEVDCSARVYQYVLGT